MKVGINEGATESAGIAPEGTGVAVSAALATNPVAPSDGFRERVVGRTEGAML